MNFDIYQNKICVVTGAASGVGLTTARQLVLCGAKVYAIDCNRIHVDGVKPIICNLSNKKSIDRAFQEIPNHIDYFFGIAGLSGAKTDYYTTFTVNFIANKYITDEYLKTRMNSNGAIVYMSSIAGNYWEKYSSEFRSFLKAKSWDKMIQILEKKFDKDAPGITAYPMSNRALNYFMTEKAIEFADMNIRVNSLLSGAIDTPMFQEFQKETNGYDKLLFQNGLLEKLATPEEIAMPLLFLNSSYASFITGICLPTDFGYGAQIKLGKKRDYLDMKVSSKLFNIGMVQNQIKKRHPEENLSTADTNPPVQYDKDGIEIL